MLRLQIHLHRRVMYNKSKSLSTQAMGPLYRLQIYHSVESEASFKPFLKMLTFVQHL